MLSNGSSSYQPISRLPIISKCLESHIKQLQLEYLSSNNLLSNDQYGFHASGSTVIPLLLATHQWHSILENGKRVACVFFDLCKAFDKVLTRLSWTAFLASKFQFYLFANYLSNRYQQVILNEVSSTDVVEIIPQKAGKYSDSLPSRQWPTTGAGSIQARTKRHLKMHIFILVKNH